MDQYAGILRLITSLLLMLSLFILNNMSNSLNSINLRLLDYESRISKNETNVNNLYRGKAP